MQDNYIVVLFKNKVKRKIINKFKTYKNANLFFNQLVKNSEKVIFSKKWENGSHANFEIALLEKSSGLLIPIYMTDEMGRNIKIDLDDSDYVISKIEPYKIEEKIFDLQTNKKISIENLITTYLDKSSIKMVSSLNNKILIQSDDSFNLFSTKTSFESHRLIDDLTKHFREIGRSNFIFVKDFDSAQRAYLYSILESKGYNKKMLYRTTTTHYHPK